MANERSRGPQVGVCGDWPVPVALQLSGQLKWAIASGEAQPGTALPTVERMAAAVGLNRNTVNAVYSELSRLGLVDMRRGTGTRVAATAEVADWQRRAPLLERIDALLDDALSLGFSPQEAAFLMLARGAWSERLQRQRPRIGLLASQDCDATGFAAALAESVGHAVETAFLTDFQHNGRALAWPPWQAAVVRAGVDVSGTPPDMWVVAADWVPAAAMLDALSQLPPGASIAAVAVTDGAARLMRQALLAGGLRHLRIFSGTTADRPLLAALPHMVQVWADHASTTLLRERQPGLTVQPFAWELVAASAEQVRQSCRRVLQQALRQA